MATKFTHQTAESEVSGIAIGKICRYLPEMIRRGGWHGYFREAAEMADSAATWMAAAAGWTPERRAQELAAFRAVAAASNPRAL